MDDNFLPTVTVVVPTTRDRQEFNERIQKIFDAQDYPHKQILFNYEDITIGEKLNKMCEEAYGAVILRMDSDDVYTSTWISASVDNLIKTGADIVGLSSMYMYDAEADVTYLYDAGPLAKDTWIAGATMCFRKSFWEANRFQHISRIEDNYFLNGVVRKPKIFSHDFIDGFCATIHSGNTCKKNTQLPEYTKIG